MLRRWQPETSTYAHESSEEDAMRILRNALMKAAGGQIAFMRALTKISALMRALAKIRGEQRLLPWYVCPTSLPSGDLRWETGAFSERFPNAILSKSRRAPGCSRLLAAATGTTFFFLDARLVNAQELRMTLVCSKESKLPQTSISIGISTSTSTGTGTSLREFAFLGAYECHPELLRVYPASRPGTKRSFR